MAGRHVLIVRQGGPMNRVLLTGRLTRDPEMRSLPSGKAVTNFSLATNEYRGGEERTEYHTVVTWDRLAEICGQYLGKGQLVSLEGRLQTRRWEDDRKVKHYRTEVVASSVKYKVSLRYQTTVGAATEDAPLRAPRRGKHGEAVRDPVTLDGSRNPP
jgi:single-strand DNA-binding protein